MLELINGKIIADRVLEGWNLWIEGGRIAAVTTRDCPGAQVIDAGGAYIAPGFIDIHTHGGGGYDFMDGTVEAVCKAASMHMSHGTTTLLPTT